MERRRGVVVRTDEPPALAHPEARRRLSGAMIETLADLHAIDVVAGGLSGLGKPAGFVARQVKGWSDRWQRSQTRRWRRWTRSQHGWMRICRRIRPVPSVVHGDFKLDNVMLHPDDVGRIVAVFDWEMSALGDPLVDLGIVLAYWSPTAPPSQRDALTTVIDRPGYFTRKRSSSAMRRGPAATCRTSAITRFSRCSRLRS
jgi:aminoglycoside phosphotransferase (APT) family kinase protein